MKVEVSDEEYEIIKALRSFRNSVEEAIKDEILEVKSMKILTEDERVILRNIDTNYYPTIKKMCKTLYIVSKEDTYKEIEYMFKDHLFRFIKERRRILNTKIIRR